MKPEERNLLARLTNNVSKMAKEHLAHPAANGAIAASPFIALAAFEAIKWVHAVAFAHDPGAIAAAHEVSNSPAMTALVSAIKGDLPFDAANSSYRMAVSSLAAGFGAGLLTKVTQKFASLSNEADLLRKENKLLKEFVANDRANGGQPGESMRSRLDGGLNSMQAKVQQREQATKVSQAPDSRPGPGLR